MTEWLLVCLTDKPPEMSLEYILFRIPKSWEQWNLWECKIKKKIMYIQITMFRYRMYNWAFDLKQIRSISCRKELRTFPQIEFLEMETLFETRTGENFNFIHL